MITSLQNNRVKEALRLRRQRGRDEQNRFMVDGLREIQRALVADIEILEAFVCEALLDDEARAIVNTIGAPIALVNLPVWDKVCYGSRRDGVTLVARIELPELSNLQPAGGGPIVVLDRIEKPGNVGAICRSATAAGASAVIAVDSPSDLFNPNAIRASLGTIFQLPIAEATAQAALGWLQGRGTKVFVARVDAAKSIYETDLAQPCAIVLGSEALGVSETWLDPALEGIVLPMVGAIDSLNVANTAAVLLYEALRQRSIRPST